MCMCVVCVFLSWILLSHCPQAQLRHPPPPSDPPPSSAPWGSCCFLGVCVCVCCRRRRQAILPPHPRLFYLYMRSLALSPTLIGVGGCWGGGSQSEIITSPLMGRPYAAVSDEWRRFSTSTWLRDVRKASHPSGHSLTFISGMVNNNFDYNDCAWTND